MKITVFQTEEWEREAFEPLKKDYDITFCPEELTDKNADQYTGSEIISTFIYSDLSSDILSKLPNLKLICTRSTGYDHIDLDYCAENNITVCNVPSYGDHTVAEHVFGLLLMISHKLYEAVDRVNKGDFSLKGLRGFDLRGKTIGIIGTGAIGMHSIRIAKGFDMDIRAFDINPDEKASDNIGFTYVSIEELLKTSDIISLHVPLTSKTKHMLSENEFDMMKDDVIIINTARGSLIDTSPFLKALSTGKVKAAGLDVLAEEPVVREESELLRSVYRKEHNLENILADHVLIRLRNVFITPHSGFDTDEAVRQILDTTIENIKAYKEGNPKNKVN